MIVAVLEIPQDDSPDGIFLIDTEKAITPQEIEFVTQLLRDNENTMDYNLSPFYGKDRCVNILVNPPAVVEKLITYYLE